MSILNDFKDLAKHVVSNKQQDVVQQESTQDDVVLPIERINPKRHLTFLNREIKMCEYQIEYANEQEGEDDYAEYMQNKKDKLIKTSDKIKERINRYQRAENFENHLARYRFD